jgi:hypothetical protein
MSKGPGRIERAIEAAFTAEPHRAFTVEGLVLIAFPGVNRIEKKHRVAVLRAAHNVAKRLNWRTQRGGENGDGLTFYNPVDIRSYAEARVRSIEASSLRSRIPRQVERVKRDIAALDDPSIDLEWRKMMKPGGHWWECVEIERLRQAGDAAGADALQAKHDAEFEGFLSVGRALASRFRRRSPPSQHNVCRHVRFIRGKRVIVERFLRGRVAE